MAVVRRVWPLLLTLIISSFVIFGALYAAPGDPVTFLIGDPERATPERIAAVRAQYHLDEPFPVQYGLWAQGVLSGDLGTSFVYRQPVWDLIASRLPSTLSLVALAALMFVVLGVGLGIVSALKRGQWIDTAITGVTTLLTSVPGFVVSLVLISVFAVRLGWFDVAGNGEGFWDRLHHLVLPAVSLAVGSLAVISRVTRQSMVEQLGLEHVEVARSYGLPEGQIVFRHVLRNALGPVLTMSGVIVAGMLGGAAIVETIFGLNGMGLLLIESINAHDFPVVQAVLLYMVLIYMVVTLAVDLLLPLLDARIREGKEPA